MEASICNLNISPFSSSSSTSQKTKPPQSFSVPLAGLSFRLREKHSHRLLGLSAGCAKVEPISVEELGRELEAEINPEGEDWMMELGKFCKERRGMVEMLERLERQAIMGEDEGREPTDYNRRAQIFDKSSRVFQALKERAPPSNQS